MYEITYKRSQFAREFPERKYTSRKRLKKLFSIFGPAQIPVHIKMGIAWPKATKDNVWFSLILLH